MTQIGKVIDIPWERDFDWRIEDFSTLSKEEDVLYKSPEFYFANESWYLGIYPNGQKRYQSVGYISVYLYRKSFGPSISLDYSLILLTMNEKTNKEAHASHVFENANTGFGFSNFLKRSEFLESRSELGLPDVLTVICTIKSLKSKDDKSNAEIARCSHCKGASHARSVQLHEKKCMEKPTRCLGCCSDFKLKDWLEHECQMKRVEASEKLSQDLQVMVFSGDHSDTIIKVKEREFQLHRGILAARNSYFNSMFKNDMKEKNTGTVTIDDCEPDIFRIFVHFLYTGKVEELSLENVCELYEVADKYQEDQLKDECLHFMMKRMSEDTFCDFIVLALKYDEKTLFEKAVKCFLSKPNAIVCSVKWQNFAREYPTQANELVVKIVQRYVK